MHRSIRLLVVVVGLALAAAACENGSSSDSGNGGDSVDTADLTGAPVKLHVIVDGGGDTGLELSRVGDAAQVAADAVNADGGVQDSPVEITLCEAGFDPNAAAGCARDAVDDGATAVVGAFTTSGDAYVPPLEEAGIPTVAPFAISFSEFSSEFSYPIIGGAPATTAGMGAQLADGGAERINVSFLDIAEGAQAGVLLQEGLTPRGLEIFSETPVPVETPDLSSVIADATDGSDSVALVLSEDDAPRWIQQASEQGVDQTIASTSAAITPDAASTLGASAEGVLVTSNFIPITESDDPGVENFLAEVDEYDSDLVIDDGSMNGWAGVHVIADVLADATGDVSDPATLISALGTATNVETGITPPLDFATPPEPIFGGAISRLFNPDVLYAVIEGGEIVLTTDEPEFINPFVAP